MKKTYSITGKLIQAITSLPVEGLQIEAWDKDLLVNDFVGEAVSDADGNFKISFTKERFIEFFLDNKPDLYFKIYKDDKLIHSTEKDVLWNIENDVKDIIIKIPNMTDLPQEKEIPNIVSGKLTNSKNQPLANLPVQVFESDNISGKLLAKTITNKEGNYEISWLQSQLGNSELKEADIAMKIVERENKTSVFTPFVNERRVNAGAKETINIAVDAVEIDPGFVEFVFIVKQVSKVTENVNTQITGIVLGESDENYPGNKFQHLQVDIFQATVNTQTLLQTVAVDEKGLFNTEITVAPNTTIMARLYLRPNTATEPEILIAQSGPHCPGGEVIALTYNYDPSKFGPPLYVAVRDAINPHLGGLQLTTLTEKQKEQLRCISGVGNRVLNRLIQAANLVIEMQLAINTCNQNNRSSARAKDPDAGYFKKAAAGMEAFSNEQIAEAIFFALVQNDDSMELQQVLTLSSDQFTQKINAAVAANIIAPIGDMIQVAQVFMFLRNCLLFNSINDSRYYDAKLIALTTLDMNSKSILLDHTIEAGGLNSFLSGQNETSTSTTLASA